MSLAKFREFSPVISLWGIFQPHPVSSLLDKGRNSVVWDAGCLGYQVASEHESPDSLLESPDSLLFHQAEGLEHLIISSQD